MFKFAKKIMFRNELKNIFTPSLLITLLVFMSSLSAQNDLIIFNDGPEKFYLYINGTKQNNTPETNVKVSNITQSWVKVKIVFETIKPIPELSANVQFVWGSETKRNWEFVYQIINKTGKYKLKPFSAAPLSNQPTNEQSTMNYASENSQPNVALNPSVNNTAPLNSQTITTTTIIATPVPSSTNNGSASININVSPVGSNIQIQNGISSTSQNTTYTTSIVSTTISSASASNGSNPSLNQPSAIKCSVNETEFEGIKKNITSKSFEDSKITIAKQICNAKCLTSRQIRDIMKLFSFEQTRLDFAKYAYKKVADKENYYVVNDAFQFESSIDELNDSIK